VAAEGGALYRGDVRLAYLSLAPCAILLAIGAACLTLGAIRLSKMTD